ncbi:MAG: OmpH family outer membrane protein [Bacteroidetes bacterium]|nr:OmpH family outer membrane protein [Bacteroidota bacterium]MBS1740586.1 OmpH family outer membrane protein [Bacteroidota bacterium]MBS1775087.1 OmpH family outer membrane protein [Bacteroidota bacterium]
MKKSVLLLACGLLASSAIFAQTKFGYINSDELLSVMPEAKKADSSLTLFAKSYQDQLEQMSKEYQKKVQDYQNQEKTMTEAMKEVKVKEIQQLEERIQSTQQSAQDKVAKKREELYSPILEKADKAIKDVAKSNNFDFVFDASRGNVLYAKESDNILPLVKAKLGIK